MKSLTTEGKIVVAVILTGLVAFALGQGSTKPKCAVSSEGKELCENLHYVCKGVEGRPLICSKKF
jgi:hypothetical protein